MNEYLYASGEVIKLWLFPRGPDSGFNVYPGVGKRYTYFDTTAITHALHEPCYIVEPHPPGSQLPPNGLPVFPVYYENDDDARRELGSDSRLTFTAPESGDYFIKLTDVRQFQGENFTYLLSIRPRQPDFKITLKNKDIKVNAGSGKEFELKAQRIDGFNGEISISIENAPPGFHVTSPVIIQAGHDVAYGVLYADENAKLPAMDQASSIQLKATATIEGKPRSYPIGSSLKISLAPSPKIRVRLLSSQQPSPTEFRNVSTASENLLELTIHPGETISAKVKVIRNDFKGVIKFGREYAGRNLPHGVYVDNIGLNGLMLLENQNERTFFVTATKWVPESSRMFHLTTSEAGKQSSLPVLLHIRHRNK